MEGYEQLYTVGEVAALCRVDEKTVRRWIQAGRLDALLTPGGQWRIRAADVRALLTPEATGPAASPAPPPGAGSVPEDESGPG